jgi:opacity protein-like surface antigen
MRTRLVIPLFVLAVCLLVQPVSAQVEKPVSLGVVGGLNFGNASFDPDLLSGYSKSVRTAIAVGGAAEFGVAEGLFVTGEALYAQRGVKVSVQNPFGGGNIDGTFKLDYIYIPVSLKYKFNIPDSKVTPYIFGGPSIAFNTKSELEVTSSSGTSTMDNKDSTESVDFAAHLGAGIEIQASPQISIFLDGRYSLSFSDADKEVDQSIKGRNIVVLGGVKFKLP